MMKDMSIEHVLSPYIAYGIMPLFALANAGVSFNNLSINSYNDKGEIFWDN